MASCARSLWLQNDLSGRARRGQTEARARPEPKREDKGGILGVCDEGRAFGAKIRRVQNGGDVGWLPPSALRPAKEPFNYVAL